MAELEVINQFKALGKSQPAVLHLLDATAERLLIVWHSGLCDRLLKFKPTDNPPGTLASHHLWAWLWNRFDVYYEKWLELASLPVSPVNLQRAKTLISTRLVYPDGTVHEWVKNMLNAKAISKYQGMTRSVAQPQPQPQPAAAAPVSAATGKKG